MLAPFVLKGRRLSESVGMWSPGALDGLGWFPPVELRRRSAPFPAPGRAAAILDVGLAVILVVCASFLGVDSVTLEPVDDLTAVGMLGRLVPKLPRPEMRWIVLQLDVGIQMVATVMY